MLSEECFKEGGFHMPHAAAAVKVKVECPLGWEHAAHW